ncbi:MAG: hypothetical protein JWN05_1320 [Arthrobacter sp.]|nr:hypothetical protein [Arthrobacter sp.]
MRTGRSPPSPGLSTSWASISGPGFCGAGADSKWRYPTNDRQPPWRGCNPTRNLGHIVTNHSAPEAAPTAARQERPRLEDLDLSPQGLADAAAHQEDPDSIVYPGNS